MKDKIINTKGVYNVEIYKDDNNDLIISEIYIGEGMEMAIKVNPDGFIKTRYHHEPEWFDVSVSTISTVNTMVEDNIRYIDEYLGIG